MVHLNIYKTIHADVQAFDGFFATTFCFLPQKVNFLLYAAVDEIKCRSRYQYNQKKYGWIKPDDEDQNKEYDETLAYDVYERQKYAGGKIHRVKVDFIQKVTGAFAYNLFERLVDDVVKCIFGKILDQPGAEPMNASLYENGKNILQYEKSANSCYQGH